MSLELFLKLRDTEKITLVAGGPSAADFDLAHLPGTIIGVNDAALLLPRCDLAVSMDRLWCENRIGAVLHKGIPGFFRKSACVNIPELQRSSKFTLFDCDWRVSTLSNFVETGRLDGSHSGLCALSLAYSMKPATLYLVGFDLRRDENGPAHWFPEYPWVASNRQKRPKLNRWAQDMKTPARQLAKAGIKVYLAGRYSAVHEFNYIDAKQLVKACNP